MVMYPHIRDRFRAGGEVSAADFVDAWAALKQLRKLYETQTAGYDAAILPSCPILPPMRAALEEEGELYTRANLMTLRNTRIANMLGLASITLPTGLPCTGIMFQGLPNSEEHLLRIAAAAERALAEKPQLAH